MILEPLLQLIAPHACLVCGREGRLTCKKCQEKIVVKKTPTCYRCNRLSDGGRTCKSCRSSSNLTGVLVASHYDGATKELIKLLKYERVRAAAPILAEAIVPLIGSDFDAITAVPVATNHYRLRGYNQAELIAKWVAIKVGLPYQRLIYRTSNVQQVGKSRGARLKQVGGVFGSRAKISGQRVLLIDDVLTTGGTLNECAKVLRQAGASRVWGAVAAKH